MLRCRILLIATAAAVLWALVISVTGGFVVEVGQVRISSRNHINPLILALATFAAAGCWRRGGNGVTPSTSSALDSCARSKRWLLV